MSSLRQNLAIFLVLLTLMSSIESASINRKYAKALIKRILRDEEFLNLPGERQLTVIEYVGHFLKQNAHLTHQLAKANQDQSKPNEKKLTKIEDPTEKHIETFTEPVQIINNISDTTLSYEETTIDLTTRSSFKKVENFTKNIDHPTTNTKKALTMTEKFIETQEIMIEDKNEDNEENMFFKW
jgi:hypothetical protein